jgi:hypothetical protein
MIFSSFCLVKGQNHLSSLFISIYIISLSLLQKIFHVFISHRGLERNVATIPTLLGRINNTFNLEECSSTLSDALELLRLMTTLDVGEDMALTRTKIISSDELRQYLLWNPIVTHPLDELEVRHAI